jgi:hypothetical protein
VVAESGVVLYLNGQEILRRNVTDDAPDARATAEGVEVYSLTVPPEHLVEGENTLAAAVKKGSREGVNLTFDLQLTAIPGPPLGSGGCGCRAGASAPGGAGLLFAAVAGLGAWRRRARGRRRGPA